MADPRQKVMSVLQGFDTPTLVKMLEGQGIKLDMPGMNEGSSSAAKYAENEPLDTFRDTKVTLGKGPGKIFDPSSMAPQHAQGVNTPHGAMPQSMQQEVPEYMQAYTSGAE